MRVACFLIVVQIPVNALSNVLITAVSKFLSIGLCRPKTKDEREYMDSGKLRPDRDYLDILGADKGTSYRVWRLVCICGYYPSPRQRICWVQNFD